MINLEELRGKDLKELESTVSQLRRKQFKLRLQHKSGDLSKTHEIRMVRKDIARVLSLQTQKNQSNCKR